MKEYTVEDFLLLPDGSRVTLSSILADEYEAYPEFPKFELIKES